MTLKDFQGVRERLPQDREFVDHLLLPPQLLSWHFQVLSRIFKDFQGLQGLLRTFKDFQGLSRTFKVFQGLSRTFNDFQVLQLECTPPPSCGFRIRFSGSSKCLDPPAFLFCPQICISSLLSSPLPPSASDQKKVKKLRAEQGPCEPTKDFVSKFGEPERV